MSVPALTGGRYRRLTPLLVLAVAVALASCTPSGGTMFEPKATRPVTSPAAEVADRAYRGVLDDVSAMLAAAYGLGRFSEATRGTGTCSTQPLAYAYTYQVDADGAVADADFAAALDRVAALVAPHGFTERAIVRDAPGSHHVVLGRADGATLSLSSAERTVLTLEGGCHPVDGAVGTP
ncbi:MAG: hypothetical protein IPJ14_14895 [Kineosporiaceae bacterium]|nr:hypothetical protein [Kineosporiaceae bacterium]